MLGCELGLDGFDYLSISNVQSEISSSIDKACEFSNELTSIPLIEVKQHNTEDVYCVGSTPIYSIDPLVRNAASLQQAQASDESAAHVNAFDIEKYGLVEGKWVKVIQGDESGIFQCVLDNKVLPGTVYIPRALPRSEKLGALYGSVELKNLSVE